jgi:hypothetical protein
MKRSFVFAITLGLAACQPTGGAADTCGSLNSELNSALSKGGLCTSDSDCVSYLIQCNLTASSCPCLPAVIINQTTATAISSITTDMKSAGCDDGPLCSHPEGLDVPVCSGGVCVAAAQDAGTLDAGPTDAGTDAGPPDAGASDAGPSPDGGPCAKNSDCGASEMCGFLESAGCSSAGTCFPSNTGPTCQLFEPGCSCSGMTINLACNGYPSGYASLPVASHGSCAIDGG